MHAPHIIENTLWQQLSARVVAGPHSPLLRPLGAPPASAADLRRAALHMALALQARGVGAADRVVVQLSQPVELIVTVFAFLREHTTLARDAPRDQ